jgi:hypothetical protein
MERGTYSSEFTRMEDFEAKPLCDIERLSMSVGKKNVMLGINIHWEGRQGSKWVAEGQTADKRGIMLW